MDAFGNTLAALSLIAFILLLPTFIWHYRCRNIPAVSLIFWLMYNNLNTFINACIWSGEDFYDKFDGKVYCDITVKLTAGSSSGKVASISALAMNLYMVLSSNSSAFIDTKSKKKIIINVLMCWFTPIFIMATNYIIQSSRYAIARYKGCTLVYDNSIATVMLYSIWTIVWSVVAFVFATLTIFKFLQKRKDAEDILRCTNSGLNLKRFARLVIFSVLIILALFPISILYFVNSIKVYSGSFDYNRVHSKGWSTITYWDFDSNIVYSSWVDVGLSIVTFLLFGIGSDAIETYRSILFKIGFKRFSNQNLNNTIISKKSSRLSNQTRVNTNSTKKSGFSEIDANNDETLASKDSNNRMVDFGDYDDLMSKVEDIQLESPFTINTSNKSKLSGIVYETRSIDLEKGSTQSDTDEQMAYIRQLDADFVDEGFDYNYQIKQNH